MRNVACTQRQIGAGTHTSTDIAVYHTTGPRNGMPQPPRRISRQEGAAVLVLALGSWWAHGVYNITTFW